MPGSGVVGSASAARSGAGRKPGVSLDETRWLKPERRQPAIEESQQHWSAVVGLTGDRRFQRQQHEVLELLAARRRRVELHRERES